VKNIRFVVVTFLVLLTWSCSGEVVKQSSEKAPEPVRSEVVDDNDTVLEIASKVVYVLDPKTKESKNICFGVIRSIENTTHSAVNYPVSIAYIPCSDIPTELLVKLDRGR